MHQLLKNATSGGGRCGNPARGFCPPESDGFPAGLAPRQTGILVHHLFDTVRGPTISLFCRGTPRGQNSTIMKNTPQNKVKAKRANGLRPEYRFDYTKAKPNRFAGRARPGSVTVLLDPDVARVFHSAESVNAVLRALVATMPSRRTQQITGGKKRPPALQPKTTHRNRR